MIMDYSKLTTEELKRRLKKAGERIEGIQEKLEERKHDVPGQPKQGIKKNREEGLPDFYKKQDNTLGADGKPKANYVNFNERWKKSRKNHDSEQYKEYPDRIKKLRDQGADHEVGLGNIGGFDENDMCYGCGEPKSKHSVKKRANGSIGEREKRTADFTPCNPKGKNPGDIFKINPRPFPEAHFATFPIDLPLKILKCGCPPNGFVLDPFMGSGTVGIAAEKLGLNWIGIELKTEYIEMARKRLEPYENEKID